MIYPLFQLLTKQPQLLLDHAEGYSELIAAEASGASAWWKRRVALYVCALCSGSVAAILAGVGTMLWTTVPAAGMHAPWVLILVPVLPAGVALWCAIAASVQAKETHFANLREQARADMAMLREATAP
ncbi:MAG: hypothetical protein U5M53_01505 [Rhodoferax sp.]|nr:hypothetical protein [Rhodoferax sp.]